MPERDIDIGTEIAGFTIGDVIGRGGMSVVYLATSRSGQRVALKLIAPQLSENQKFRDRFGRESRVAASLEHANVVPVLETGEANGHLYIAMRYVEGTDLATLIRSSGPLSPERTISIVEQVAAGLDAAHHAGLVHRDVKPANILVEPGAEPETDHAYLSDFGLTKRALSVSGFTATGELVGTVDYVAPEQIRGDPLDGRTDVYSLGAVVVECLTGDVPFPRDAEVATLWAHIQDPPPRVSVERPELSTEIDDVVARAMAKIPADRYPSAGAMADDLRERTIEARRRPSRRRWRPAAQRRRRRLIGLTVALLVLAGGVGVYLVSRPGPPIVPGVNTLASIDPSARRFDQAIGVAQGPNGVAVGEGSVWVISQDDGVIQRIDPTSGEPIVAGKSTNGPPTGVAAGEGAAWLTTGFSGASGSARVQQVNLNTNDVTPLPFEAPSGGQAIAAGAGWIWLADPNRDRVWKIDPTTLGVADRIAVGSGEGPAGPQALSVVEGDTPVVWVANTQGSSVSRIEVASGGVETFPVPGNPDAIAADASSVWVASQASDQVYRIDAAAGSVISEVDVPDGPFAIAIGPDGPWVCSYLAGVVVRIDPRTDTVAERLTVNGSPVAIAADPAGALWVVVRSE